MDGNLTWLFAAFAIGWLIVFVYLFAVARREASLRRRLTALEDLLHKR